MIEYLEKLVEENDFGGAQALAEQLILNSDNSLEDMMKISHALQTCRFHQGDHLGSIIPGQMAVNIARDLSAWNHYGEAQINLGAAFVFLRQFDSAREACYEYLSYLSRYSWASIHEWRAWYNLGIVSVETKDGAQAAHSFARALQVVERSLKPRFVHGVRHALIAAHLAAGNYEHIPCLLSQCARYLRQYPDDHDIEASRLWHYVLRTEFAIRTRRLQRARKLTARGLSLSQGRPQYLFRFYILAAKAELVGGNTSTALSNSVIARVHAIRAKRFDLEAEASEVMYDILRHSPETILAGPEPYLFPDFGSLFNEPGSA